MASAMKLSNSLTTVLNPNKTYVYSLLLLKFSYVIRSDLFLEFRNYSCSNKISVFDHLHFYWKY